ncbi:MAG TPA: cyclase family protein [Pseudonocardia sp.]|jgi:kynurenine formamidase
MVKLNADWVASECERLSNWGRWGSGDQLGAWNLVTPEKVVEAARCVRTGRVFSLALPFGAGGPNENGVPGRSNATLFVTVSGSDIETGALDRLWPGSGKFTDDFVTMSMSSSTQWDGFPHCFHNGRGWNGVPASSVTSLGARRNSVAELKDRMLTRAVLLDVPRALGVEWLEPGTPIQPEDLDATLAAQRVDVRPGDAVLIRTGQLAQVRAVGKGWGDYAGRGPAPGLGARCGAWLHERDVTAVATDTWGFEVSPHETTDTVAPLHQILLAHCGITIGEMFDLEALAADCGADQVYECMLSAPPLPVRGAINTPVNPLAVK